MKQLVLLFSLFLFFGFTASAQDLSKKTKQELEQMKTQAVKEQNFQLAETIKTELNNRKSIDDLIADRKNELYEAAKNGDMARAEALKNEVQRLESVKTQLTALEEQLSLAVKEERYGDAQQLKTQIDTLKNPGAPQCQPGKV